MAKYILFDLDGTLTDPAQGITNCIMYALGEMGYDIPPRDELYKFIGPPLVPSFMKYFGMTEECAKEALRLYRVRFSSVGWKENTPYAGIREQLELVKKLGQTSGVKLALATSKPEEFAVNIMREFELAEYFDAICGSTMDGSRVEKGDVIRYALESLGFGDGDDPGEIVMIGDRMYDIDGAKEVGAVSVGVTWGYGDEAELAEHKADVICRNVSDLAQVIADL